MDNQKKIDSKFAKFHRVDRDRIQWNPIVNEEKCIGCGLCVTSCGRGVYKFDYKNRKTKVVNPSNCMTACITCSNLCPVQAISFSEKNDTPRNKAQRIVNDFQLIAKVKTELEERKEELTFNK